MKLSQDQIAELYKFTRTHYVEHYDVQTELVDHLANGIEHQWEGNPNLPFREALKKEFKKFGVFGFHDVVKEKIRAMEKRYWKVFLGFYKDYFKLPKVLLLLAGTFLLFAVLRSLQPDIGMYIPGGLLLSFLLILLIGVLKNRRKQKKKEKKWLLEECIAGYGNSFVFGNFFIQILINPHWLKNGLVNPYSTLLISFVAILILVLVYVTMKVIPEKSEELLAETYPEYKMS